MRAQISFFQSNIKRVAGLISLGLICIGSVHAAEPYKAVIVLFGDSLTTGVNLDYRERYGNGSTTRGCPTIYLNNILRQEQARTSEQTCSTETLDSPILDQNNKFRDAIVANWGLGGSHTTTGESRISSDLSETKNTLDAEKYFVLIMYGTNDPAFGISTTTTKFNTRQMIISSRALGYEPIVGTITPRDDVDITPYNTQIVSAANQEGVFVVDHFNRFINQPAGWRSLLVQELDPSTNQLARLHPNDQGYLVIAETWFDKRLEDLIPGVSNFSIAPIVNLLLE